MAKETCVPGQGFKLEKVAPLAMDEVTGQMRAHDDCVSCGSVSEGAVASVAKRLGRGIGSSWPAFGLDIGANGWQPYRLPPVLLDICCVNRFVAAFYALGISEVRGKNARHLPSAPPFWTLATCTC